MWDEYDYEELFSNDRIKKCRNSYLEKITKVFYEELTDKPIVIDREKFWQNTKNIENLLKYKKITIFEVAEPSKSLLLLK